MELRAISVPSPTNKVRKAGTGRLSTREGCSRAIASLLAQEIIKLVGGKRTDRVILVGCEHIELLIELAHRGFVDVTCCIALAVPNAGEMSGDMIIAPSFDRETKSAAALAWMERGLRSNGVLLLGIAGTGLSTQIRQVQRRLIQRGFSVVCRHIEPAGLHILCCRKLPILQAQAA